MPTSTPDSLPTPAPPSRAAPWLAAVATFYPACIGWYVVLATLGYLMWVVVVPLHFLGASGAGPVAAVWQGLRLVASPTAPMLVFATLASLVAAWIVHRRAKRTSGARSLRPALAILMLAAALLIDVDNELTPLGSALAARLPDRAPVPTRAFAVREFAALRDSDTGTIARVTALLDYSRQLRRFELVDPDDAGARITLDARPNRSGWVREALAEGVDRRVETQLLPLVGRRVVVIGRVGRNDLSARANDVAPASEVDSPPAKIAS